MNLFTGLHDTNLQEGERIYRILTENYLDELYAVRPSGESVGTVMYTDDEFQMDLKSALRRKYGRRGPSMLRGVEDVTELYREAER